MKERFDATFEIDLSKPISTQEINESLRIDLPNEPGVYKVELRADDYPNNIARAYKLKSGDSVFIPDIKNTVKIGDKFQNYPAIISQIYYEPKKWWQFWKRKKQIGYRVRWL